MAQQAFIASIDIPKIWDQANWANSEPVCCRFHSDDRTIIPSSRLLNQCSASDVALENYCQWIITVSPLINVF